MKKLLLCIAFSVFTSIAVNTKSEARNLAIPQTENVVVSFSAISKGTPSNFLDLIAPSACTRQIRNFVWIGDDYYQVTVTATAATCAEALKLATQTYQDVIRRPYMYQ